MMAKQPKTSMDSNGKGLCIIILQRMKPNIVCPKQGGKPEEFKSYLVSPPPEVFFDAMTTRPFGFCILRRNSI
jgi:hypothetical protein